MVREMPQKESEGGKSEVAEISAALDLSKTQEFPDFVKSVAPSVKSISNEAEKRYGHRGIKRAILALGLFVSALSGKASAEEVVQKSSHAEVMVNSLSPVHYEGVDEDLKESVASYNRALRGVKFVLGNKRFMDSYRENIDSELPGENLKTEALRTAKVLENSSVPYLVSKTISLEKNEGSVGEELAVSLKGDVFKEMSAYNGFNKKYMNAVEPLFSTEGAADVIEVGFKDYVKK